MLSEFRSTNITWDKATSRIYSPVTANASDENGRKLVVQIVNGGQVEDLTGATLHLYWETINKAHDGLDVFAAVDLKKGEFELSYTTGMLSNKGVLNANLVLIYTVGRVVSERFKITVTEGIDNDAIQSENSFSSLTQALIDISNLEQNYAPRLNDLTAQLQQTETKIEAVENANSKQKLSFLNPYDNDQNIHPKVLDFGNLWNGHRYWMAYTPFPWRNDKRENPSVAVANEINKWQHKIMLADTPQPTNINHYNNDTHIVYRSDLNRLEVWWRYYNQPDNIVLIKRRTTTNGTTWSAEETMISSTTANQILSPALVFEDGKYKMWFCEPDGNVYYQENTDTEGKIWGERKLLNVPKPSDVRWWWHLDVIKTDLGYEILVQGVPFGVPSAEYANLYYTKTTDNVNFDLPILILEPSKREGAFDNKGIYRSSFIKKEGTYYVFYSGFAQDGTTGLGLSTGADIQNLAGATSLNRYMSNVERIDLGYSYLKEGEIKLSNGQFANVMRPSYADILRFYKANGTDIAEIGVGGLNVGNSYLKDNELKLSNGIYASIIKMLVSGYLEIKDNDGKPVALQVAGIKLNSTNALALGGEGALKYDAEIKKFQGSNDQGWQNLNREVTVPLSATANGVKGDYAVTSGYLYVCVATNTWQRVALSSW